MNSDECRSRQLLRYFGQDDSADCGTCDVCRAHKNRKAEVSSRDVLKAYLKAHPSASPAEIKAWCNNPSSGLGPDAMEIYRQMLDEADA